MHLPPTLVDVSECERGCVTSDADSTSTHWHRRNSSLSQCVRASPAAIHFPCGLGPFGMPSGGNGPSPAGDWDLRWCGMVRFPHPPFGALSSPAVCSDRRYSDRSLQRCRCCGATSTAATRHSEGTRCCRCSRALPTIGGAGCNGGQRAAAARRTTCWSTATIISRNRAGGWAAVGGRCVLVLVLVLSPQSQRGQPAARPASPPATRALKR